MFTGWYPAEAAAENKEARIVVFLANERHGCIEQVRFVAHLARDAQPRRQPVVVPAFQVHRINAEKMRLPGIDPVRQSANHATVLSS